MDSFLHGISLIKNFADSNNVNDNYQKEIDLLENAIATAIYSSEKMKCTSNKNRKAGKSFWKDKSKVEKRAEQMFNNFINQYERFYKNQKVIISVSAFHGAKLLPDNKTVPIHKRGFINLGTRLNEYFKDDLFVITFGTSSGCSGYVNQTGCRVTHSAKKGSLESGADRLTRRDKGVGYYTFKELEKDLFLKDEYDFTIFEEKPSKYRWSEVFDGLIYVREMEPDTLKFMGLKPE